MLNHQMLLTLIEKVNGMQKNKQLLWEMDSDDDDWSLWVDSESPEDVDKLEHPDYMLPEEVVGENTSAITSTTRTYNLRNRLHRL